MVGRDRELARVTGLLDDALAGRGRLVLCTGEAGIGKTRLAEELAAAAEAGGIPVAWARAADPGSSPPYGLWRLVLSEPVLRGASGSDMRAFGAAWGPDPGADSGIAQRFALFADVRRRLAQAAEQDGLVPVLDDLQWADEASAVLLADVVRQLRGTRILVFATYRDSESSGIGLRLSAEANTERVDLQGLPAEAVGDLLIAAGLDASPTRARQVQAETGGNPFLVRELALTLTGPDGAAVPGRVVEATAYRLTLLSDEAREVLQAAAVAGNSFSVGVVAKMLEGPVLSVLGPLEECAEAGFLVAGDRPGEQRFSHALVSSAVVARLSAEEQRRLHAAAADAIEALYEGGHALAVVIGLGRTADIEFLASKFEPFQGQHAANGAGAGVYMGPVELQLGLTAAALGRLEAAAEDLAAAVAICDANGCPVPRPVPRPVPGRSRAQSRVRSRVRSPAVRLP